MNIHVDRVVMHRRGVADLLTSEGVRGDLGARAERMKSAAEAVIGDDYPKVAAYNDTTTKGDSFKASRRARAAVVVLGQHTEAAKSSAATALLSSLDAAS